MEVETFKSDEKLFKDDLYRTVVFGSLVVPGECTEQTIKYCADLAEAHMFTPRADTPTPYMIIAIVGSQNEPDFVSAMADNLVLRASIALAHKRANTFIVAGRHTLSTGEKIKPKVAQPILGLPLIELELTVVANARKTLGYVIEKYFQKIVDIERVRALADGMCVPFPSAVMMSIVQGEKR